MQNFIATIKQSTLQRVANINDLPDFCAIFQKTTPTIIAEIKFSSPASGQIYKGTADHLKIAADYLAAGAAALSVLTEPEYFKGNIQFVADIRQQFPSANILLKDFVLHPKQILQAKQYGANAILLIAAMLQPAELKHLYSFALDCGLTPLIEVHNLPELMLVLELNPKLIGINNRCLTSLTIDLNLAADLIKHIPKQIHVICESGINTAEQLIELNHAGFKGFLIGSMFMRSQHPGAELTKLLNEVQYAS